ncbi:MAG: hypothetical protein ACPL07_01705 [Candidatus Bathyarchaeia archaeon]
MAWILYIFPLPYFLGRHSRKDLSSVIYVCADYYLITSTLPWMFKAYHQGAKALHMLMRPFLKQYYMHGYFAYKKLLEISLRLLLPKHLVEPNAPASTEVILTIQYNRITTHMINFQPQRKGESSGYIEEAYPIKKIYG